MPHLHSPWDTLALNNANSVHNNFPLVINISCTVVVKIAQVASSPYSAYTLNRNVTSQPATTCCTNLFAIAISPPYLTTRQDGATSIMAESLLYVLREHISQPTIRLRPLIRDSILGFFPDGMAVSLATTRVPDFGDEMESPHTGYQELSTNASSPIMKYSGVAFDPYQELMSMAPISSYNSAKLADFTWIWQTLIHPASHFFLIFQINFPIPIPSPNLNMDIGLLGATGGALASPSQYSLPMPQTSGNSPPPNVEVIRNPSCALPIASYSLDDHGSQFEQQLRIAIGPSLTPQHIKDAVSLKDKPLFQNYKNWLAMASLLDTEVINLPGLAGGVTTTKFSANDAAEILRYFNWAPTSYYKKRRLFLWAYSAACTQWNGPTGSIHRAWKGIVYLWGKGGAFERNAEPERRSNNPDERCASQLTQDAIEKKKSDISRHILELEV